MNELEQLIEIAKLAHSLAATANCDHPWAKDFKNRMLVKISKLPRHIKDEIITSREDEERQHKEDRCK
jgi:hypothetical protein